MPTTEHGDNELNVLNKIKEEPDEHNDGGKSEVQHKPVCMEINQEYGEQNIDEATKVFLVEVGISKNR